MILRWPLLNHFKDPLNTPKQAGTAGFLYGSTHCHWQLSIKLASNRRSAGGMHKISLGLVLPARGKGWASSYAKTC